MAIEAHEGNEKLSKAARSLLLEAIRRGEDARDKVEGALMEYGRWLLGSVFKDDTTAALEQRNENPVWRALAHRAGGPTLRVSLKFLVVAVRIAAYDKRINDDAWRLLEPGRKELLLPLGDENALRDAAKRVVAMKMSQRATKEFVSQTRAAQGRAKAPRATPKQLASKLARINKDLLGGSAKRVEAMMRKSNDEERKAIQKELEQLAGWVKATLGRLRAAKKA